MNQIGFAFGRFQPLHNGHMQYLNSAIRRSEKIIIGITNPDPHSTRHQDESAHRDTAEANFLTYYERYNIIKEVLLSNKVSADRFDIFPFPVNFPELYSYYLPSGVTVYLSILEKWGYTKLENFKSQGVEVEILFEGSEDKKIISGKEIRRMIVSGEDWIRYVPEPVHRYLVSNHLKNRLIALGRGVNA